MRPPAAAGARPHPGASLDHGPFGFRPVPGGRVLLYWEGRHVVTLAGAAAQRFLRRADGLPGPALQGMTARATGNFKRGNERSVP